MTRIIPCVYINDQRIGASMDSPIKTFDEALPLIAHLVGEGVKELIVLLVSNASDQRKAFHRFLSKIRKQFPEIRLISGGNLHNQHEVKEIFKDGADSIILNSSAVRNPDLINYTAKTYGTESLIVGIDTKFTFGEWKVYISGGKSRTEMDTKNWAKLAQLRGAGELILSCLSKSEKQGGYQLINEIIQHADIPVLAAVHSATLEDCIEMQKETHAAGLVSTSYFSQADTSYRMLLDALSNSA